MAIVTTRVTSSASTPTTSSPEPKGCFELLRVQSVQDAKETFLGLDVVLEDQKAAQLGFLRLRPEGDVFDGGLFERTAALMVTSISGL